MNALENGKHCICKINHANSYWPSARRSGKNEEYKHQQFSTHFKVNSNPEAHRFQ